MAQDIGVIGMAVMGSNLALNMADHGFRVSVYNYTPDLTKQFTAERPHENITPYYDLKGFVDSLEKPRKVMLMIMAGAPVGSMVLQLLDILEPGDIIIDGGNSFFGDTRRRCIQCKEKGVLFFGMGISGGEEGARKGPSIMPGGDASAYEAIRPVYEAIAAKADDSRPCCAYIGENGAGHFVKMVHNGIEYADMQLIAETYLLLKYVGRFTNQEMSEILRSWNQGELKSFLIGAAADILAEHDDVAAGYIIDKIVDKAGQKGTGRWTCMEAMRLGVNVSMIDAACNTRISSNDSGRITARRAMAQSECSRADKEAFAEMVRKSLYTAKIIAYAQGFSLYHTASDAYGWHLNFSDIASVFRAGCIIQADFLNKIVEAFQHNPSLENLMFDEFFLMRINDGTDNLRHTVSAAALGGIPVPAYMSALEYIDIFRSRSVGANLIQGLRDYFGAHTFERVDTGEAVHHDWKRH